MGRIIRPITKDDTPYIHGLITRSGPFVSPRSKSDYWLYATLFSDTCLCLIENDDLCGVVLAFTDQSRNFEELYIQDLAVLPNHRKFGVGSALLEALLMRARSFGVKKVWLTSEPRNAAAIALWCGFGFENPEADYLDNGYWVTKNLKGKSEDRVIFIKNIC